ncbi:hypothetical protein SAMN02745866_04236 [Alteromonadaceae bacterium Bs31]|nr:hypothetical protein SAMN02745866_04236 [Alteromonadaceae bacterium Bs31]
MPKRQKPRNFHACHAIMRKGGVHEKTKGAKRAAVKHDTRRKANEWLGRSHLLLTKLFLA